jgi:hypothetical protein
MFNIIEKIRDRYPYTTKRGMLNFVMKSIIIIVAAAVLIGCGIAQIKSGVDQVAASLEERKIERELFDRELMIIGKDSNSMYKPLHTEEEFEVDTWKAGFVKKSK